MSDISSPTIVATQQHLLPFTSNTTTTPPQIVAVEGENRIVNSNSDNNNNNSTSGGSGNRSRGNSGGSTVNINNNIRLSINSLNSLLNQSPQHQQQSQQFTNSSGSNNNSPSSLNNSGSLSGRKRSHSDLTQSFLEAKTIMEQNNKDNNNNNNSNSNSNNKDINDNPDSMMYHHKSLLPPIPFIPLSPNKSYSNNNESTKTTISLFKDEDIINIKDIELNNSNDNIINQQEIYLPIDVLDLIFSQLSFIDRCVCASVCSSWRNVLLMQPYPLLENCFVSLHNPTPEYSLPTITHHLINNFNITISPCSCHKCYYINPPYRFLFNWMEYLKSFYSVPKLKKLVFRVFQNNSHDLHSSSPSLSTSGSSNNNCLTAINSDKGLFSPISSSTSNTQQNMTPSSPMPTFPEFSISQQNNINNNNNNNGYNLNRPNHFLQQGSFLSGLRTSGDQHPFYYHQQQPSSANIATTSSTTTTTTTTTSNMFNTLMPDNQQSELLSTDCECFSKINKESMMNDISKFILDLEKPLTLPIKDRDAIIPLSTLFQFLDSCDRVEKIKMRVCVDLPYSKSKELSMFRTNIKNADKVTELGLLNHDPSDTSMSSAFSKTAEINLLLFSTIFQNANTFINLKRLYLITTNLDTKALINLKKHLPNLSGLHLSVWNSNVGQLIEMITSVFGSGLKELTIRFTTCFGIKYSPFSHTEYKLEDSMIEMLVKKCPNLEHFSFEGWLSNISSKSFQLLSQLKMKHLVLKNGPHTQTACKPMFARLKLESIESPYQSILISEQEIKNFVKSQPLLKVLEINAPQIYKFTTSINNNNNHNHLDQKEIITSTFDIVYDIGNIYHSPNIINSPDIQFDSLNSYLSNLQKIQKNLAFSHNENNLNLSDDLVTFFIESCPNLKYLKIVDRLNLRSHIRANRNKYHKLPNYKLLST